MEGGGFGNWNWNGNGNVVRGEKESGGGSEGMVVVACDLVAASRFETVTRKRGDRFRRRKMGSSPVHVSVSAAVPASSSSSSSSTLGFSSLTVIGSGLRLAPNPVAAFNPLPRPPPTPSSPRPTVFRLTPVYDIDRTKLRFLFQKTLKNSDVNYLKRIIIPKKAAETHLPTLQSRPIQLTAYDVDGHHKWTFKYRFWPNNASRMYVLENAGDFVAVHALRAGDAVIMYSDIETHNFVIEAKKSETPMPAADHEVKQSSEVESEIANPPKDIFPNFPPMGDSGNQLFYDTSSICNESPLDFLGESAYHQYPSSSQKDFTDNMSFDDFHF